MPTTDSRLSTALIVFAAAVGCTGEPRETDSPDGSQADSAAVESVSPGHVTADASVSEDNDETLSSKTRQDGVWEVLSINEMDCGTWQGTGPDGEDIGGVIWSYTATCRDGDLDRTFTLASDTQYCWAELGIRLKPGDRFRVIQGAKEVTDTDILLPSGTVVRKLDTVNNNNSKP